MIPEEFKQNISFEISPFHKPVQVDYRFYWPEKRVGQQEDPLICHIEFRASPGPISETGYYSYFFHSKILENGDYKTIEEFALAAAEYIAKENGYKPPEPTNQLSLF
ncbi:hypothetical protein [Pedobacter aquatilis]|uniref:hypothetical protein n=1 Tax=Pedobacter aquatilis TaxID=351343 RepID=UPI00293090C7|nr:hypothetical protein [Pedobacter aquatilis]